MTEQELSEIRQRLDAISHVPQELTVESVHTWIDGSLPNWKKGGAHHNVIFVEHAPGDVAALLEEVARLRSLLEQGEGE